MIYCGECGAQNADGLGFCTNCGADLQRQRTPPPEASVEDHPPGAEPEAVSLGAGPTELAGPRIRDLPAGTLIGGRYEAVRKLGKGGMGIVYLARDTQLPREVAIKLLLPSFQFDKHVLSRFRREAEAIAGLNHANIVQIFDATESEDFGYFIAMEYVAGGSLDDLLKAKGRMELPRAKEIATAILRALSYAHKQRVVHRDLKPTNVLLTADGTPKVVDFGLAQLRGPSDLSVTGYGMGTPYYVAPEQQRDARNTDHRADLFAFGATLYHMVTGERPVTIRETLVPADVRDVTLACLEEKPENRPFSANEVLLMLQKVSKAPAPTTHKPSDEKLEEGKCLGCGHINDAEARFCESCGAGLYEKCPQCEHEVRIGRQFCSRCGLNVPKYKKFLDHLKAAREHERVGRLSRAVKEATAAGELGFESQETAELLERCQARQAEVKALKDRAEAAWQREEYEAAQDAYQAVLQITPSDSEVVGRVAEAPGLIRARDIGRHLAAAEAALDRREYETADSEAAAVLALDAEHEPAAEVQSAARERLARLNDIQQRGAGVFRKQQYREAIETWQGAVELASADRRARLQQQIAEAKGKLGTLSDSLAAADEDLELGDYEAAEQRAQLALEIQSYNAKAAEVLEAAREGKERMLGYLKIARSLLEAKRYWAARDEFDKVLTEVQAAESALRKGAEAGQATAARRIQVYESSRARAEDLYRTRKFSDAAAIWRKLIPEYPRRSEALDRLDAALKGRRKRRSHRAVGSLITGVVLAGLAVAGVGYGNWRFVRRGEELLASSLGYYRQIPAGVIDANAPASRPAAADPNAEAQAAFCLARASEDLTEARAKLQRAGGFLFGARRDAGLCVADAHKCYYRCRFADALEDLVVADGFVSEYPPAETLRKEAKRSWCALAGELILRHKVDEAAAEMRKLETYSSGPAVAEGIRSSLHDRVTALAVPGKFPEAVDLISRIRKAGKMDDVVEELDLGVKARWATYVKGITASALQPNDGAFRAAAAEIRIVRSHYPDVADSLQKDHGPAWVSYATGNHEAAAATGSLKTIKNEFSEYAGDIDRKLAEIKARWEKSVAELTKPGSFGLAHTAAVAFSAHYEADVQRFVAEIKAKWLAHVEKLTSDAVSQSAATTAPASSFVPAEKEAVQYDDVFAGSEAAGHVRKHKTKCAFDGHLAKARSLVAAPGDDFRKAMAHADGAQAAIDSAKALLTTLRELWGTDEADRFGQDANTCAGDVRGAKVSILDGHVRGILSAAGTDANDEKFENAMAGIGQAETFQKQMEALDANSPTARESGKRIGARRSEVGSKWSEKTTALADTKKFPEAYALCQQMSKFAGFQTDAKALRTKIEQTVWESQYDEAFAKQAAAGGEALAAQKWKAAETAYLAAIEVLGRYGDYCRTHSIGALAEWKLGTAPEWEASGVSAAGTVTKLRYARAWTEAMAEHAKGNWQDANTALQAAGKLTPGENDAAFQDMLDGWSERLAFRIALQDYRKLMQDANELERSGEGEKAIAKYAEASRMMPLVTNKEIKAMRRMFSAYEQVKPLPANLQAGWVSLMAAYWGGAYPNGMEAKRLKKANTVYNDLWGKPYKLEYDAREAKITRITSWGPNGKDDGGAGDDITGGP